MGMTPQVHLAPSGLIAKYFGDSGGSTTRYYWVQAIYPSGFSGLAGYAAVSNTPASLSQNNRVQISWNPMPGAIGYNVFYTTTTSAPVSGSVALALNINESSYSDVGVSAQAYVMKYPGVKFARGRYSFAVDGGTQGSITPVESDTIPSGALVIGGCVHVPAAVTSGGSATVAVGTSAGSSTTSILGATAKASLTLNAVIVSAANAAPFRMSAAGTINFTIGTADLTAGIVDAYVLYISPTAP